jgi:cytochrome c oxidase assembly protein subunit 15
MQGKIVILLVTVGVLFSLLTVGAYVTAANFGGFCGLNTPEDWPLCNGQLLPPPDIGSIIEYTHRILASFSGLFLILSTVLFWRSRETPRAPKVLLLTAVISILVEIGVGEVVVNSNLSPLIVTVHQALAMLVFGLTVGAAALVYQTKGKTSNNNQRL